MISTMNPLHPPLDRRPGRRGQKSNFLAITAVQVSGIEQTIEIDMNLFEWDKIYLNPLYGMAMPDHDFPKLLELYR